MNWLGRYRLLILASICVFWTGLIFVGHFFPTDAVSFGAVARRTELSKICFGARAERLRRRNDFVFLGLDQSTLQLPPLTPDELANNRAFQLMTERPFPWSRELWALLLDRLFAAGARVVMFDLMFNQPNDGDPAFHAALDRYRDKVVVAANFDLENGCAGHYAKRCADSAAATAG